MLFAAIGCINGNSAALKSALAAIAEEGIHTILHTGNAVAGGEGGAEVLALLSSASAICVQGNHDRLVVRYARKQQTLESKIDESLLAAVRTAHQSLTSEHLECLRDWRKSRIIPLELKTGFLCHGSPGNPREILDADTPVVKLQRQREIARTDVIVCGGGDPFIRVVDGTLFVSPGPLADNAGRAHYTVIDTDAEPCAAIAKTASA